jgi:MFS transporter, DHA2 family, multidrug resistance protein
LSIAAAPAAVEIDGPRRALITVSVMLASILQTLDTTIANVALPHIQGSVSAAQDQISWVLTSYIVAAAIMTPLSGWLAGRFGRKRVFSMSIVGFTVASMLCGVAQSLPQIVLARLLQGLCGAALVPMSQALLLDINPPERHARAMAVWGMGIMLGPIIGPALGGWLTDNYDWRWVFYINVPFGILAFLGILSSMRETETHRSRFDVFGFTVLSVSVGALQLMLDRGQLKDWFSSTEICIESAVAAVAFYLFVVHMLTATRARFVSPAIFMDRNFLTGVTLMFVVGATLYATLALLPPLLQGLLNYPVLTTGLVTSPRGVGTLIAMFVSGRLMGKIDARLIIGTGFALTAFSLWQMTGFDLQMSSSTVLWSGFAQGLGTGFVAVPVSAAAFVTLARSLRNEGTAIFSLMRNLGSSIGISAVQALLTRNTQIVHAQLAEHVTPYNPLLQAQLHGQSPTVQSLAGLNATVTEQAAMIAYVDDFKLMMVLSLATLPLVLLMRKGNARAAEPLAVE